MWRKINIVFLAGIITLATCPARGQDAPSAPLLDHTHALQAHLQVEKWLADGVVPPPELVPPVHVRGLTGICITFRTSGITVGEGQVTVPADTPEDTPIDMAALLREATQFAIDSLKQSLKDANMRAAVDGRGSSLPTQPSVRDIAPQIQIDVQLAAPLEDVRIPPEAPANRLYARFAPGYHGLRLTDPDNGRLAVMWPATALAQNVSPKSQIVQLLSHLDRNIRDEQMIGRPKGLPLQRFAVFHVVPPAITLPPMHLERGGVVLPQRTIDAATLGKLGSDLADHLATRFAPGGEMRGTYHPTTGQYDPVFAEPEEALLTAYAVTRYVRFHRAARPDDPTLAVINSQAQTLARRLDAAMIAGELEKSPAFAGLLLLVVTDNAIPPRQTEARDRMIDLLVRLRTEDGGFLSEDKPDAPAANQTVSAIAVAGLAAAYEQTRRPELEKPLSRALDRLWEQSSRSPNINALPWLAMAHERVAGLLAKDEASQNIKKERDAVIASLVRQMIRVQVVDAPRIGPADVVGGFDVKQTAPESPPNPDWTTAHLLMFLSLATRQPEIRAGQDELGWVLSAGLSARFLRQLQMQSTDCYYVRSPGDAIGGVRLALWNNAMPLRASAMSLLAVTELEQMLDALE